MFMKLVREANEKEERGDFYVMDNSYHSGCLMAARNRYIVYDGRIYSHSYCISCNCGVD